MLGEVSQARTSPEIPSHSDFARRIWTSEPLSTRQVRCVPRFFLFFWDSLCYGDRMRKGRLRDEIHFHQSIIFHVPSFESSNHVESPWPSGPKLTAPVLLNSHVDPTSHLTDPEAFTPRVVQYRPPRCACCILTRTTAPRTVCIVFFHGFPTGGMVGNTCHELHSDNNNYCYCNLYRDQVGSASYVLLVGNLLLWASYNPWWAHGRYKDWIRKKHEWWGIKITSRIDRQLGCIETNKKKKQKTCCFIVSNRESQWDISY